MKYKFPVILALLILIPLLVLGWMGIRLQNNEAIVDEHQFQHLIDLRLREADQVIVAYLTKVENNLLTTPHFYGLDVNQRSIDDEIRDYILQSSYIENIFILNQNGERLHPPSGLLTTEKERQFIERTEGLWDDMTKFYPSVSVDTLSEQQLLNNAEEKYEQYFSVSRALSKIHRIEQEYPASEFAEDSVAVDVVNKLTHKSSMAEGDSTRYGWTIWYAGTEKQTFFWFWDSLNNLVGLKLAEEYWLFELIGQFLDGQKSLDILGDAKIKLFNEKQKFIHQWGNFDVDIKIGSQQQFKLRGQRLLGSPLDGWRLAYFSPQIQDHHNLLHWLFYIVLLAGLSLLLIGLAIYIMREYRRDMRVAEQKVTFVNQVSHELKTPLTNICMYAELLDTEMEDVDTLDEGLVKKYSFVLTTESQRLGRLINNVLTFSRAQKQQTRLNLQNGIIDDTLRKTIEIFKPAFDAKGIVTELNLQATELVRFDVGILEQIINNLLGNIEKYAHQGEYAKVSSSQRNGVTTIMIEDAGDGIDDKLAKSIFQPFYRGNSKLTEGVSGTGIGLSIARDLCRLHDGDLQLVTKKSVKKGACFIITLATPKTVLQEEEIT